VRGERLETRATADQKSLIEHAAALQGRTVTDFVLMGVQEAAQRAIEEHQRLDLSVRDSQAFVNALINPQPVDDRLRDTVQRYRRTTGVYRVEEFGEDFVRVEVLGPQHDRASFDSGVEPLDRYFRTQAG
jgi:uncharacterized protein (DUF1778 family)